MDSKACLEWLPEEVVELIAEHLTARDLARCCAVSVGWREAFGSDRLWRRHYDPTLAPFLATSRPVVHPSFLSPETLNSTLSTISPARLCCIREKYLENNWCRGNFKIEEMQKEEIETYSHNGRSTKIFYKNDYILEFSKNTLIVWDVKDTISRVSDFYFFLSPDCNFHLFEIKENMIVVVQSAFVQVLSLDLSTKELQIHHSFLLERLNKCSNVSDETLKNLIEPYVQARFTVLENILIGTVVSFESSCTFKLHFWNVESGEKLKEEIRVLENTSNFYSDIAFECCHETMNILLTYIVENSEGGFRLYYVYNLPQLTFFPFSKKFDIIEPDFNQLYAYTCVICRQYIAIGEDFSVYIYNYNTSELMHTLTHAMGLAKFGNDLLFEHRGVLSILDLTSNFITAQFDIEDRFPKVIGNKALFTHHTSQEFFLEFVAKKEFFRSSDKNVCVVPVYSFTTWELVVNKSLTKILLEHEKSYVVVHFW